MDSDQHEFITIVSGLPRSGTSMMMRMLEAGGMDILTDAIRVADESNPKGYYEYERVKKLREGDTSWLSHAEGKVVKVISFLLKDLPLNQTYKIIFMQRKMEEVLSSQKKMLQRRGEVTDDGTDLTLAASFEKHLRQTQEWLKQQKDFRVYYVSYNDLLANPDSYIDAISQFLSIPLHSDRMREVIDKNLYRNRI